MPRLRISEAAQLLGVSDDSVRRWVHSGRLEAADDDAGRMTIDGAALAGVAQEVARPASVPAVGSTSARNQMRGLVTRVLRDTVMAQVDVQCGPFRMVSLMSREAVDELGLEPGSVAVVSIKSTNVVIGTPA